MQLGLHTLHLEKTKRTITGEQRQEHHHALIDKFCLMAVGEKAARGVEHEELYHSVESQEATEIGKEEHLQCMYCLFHMLTDTCIVDDSSIIILLQKGFGSEWSGPVSLRQYIPTRCLQQCHGQ